MCLVLGVYDNGSLAVSKTVSGGSNPSGTYYMEFVAQWVERQNVDLMVAGSKPVKLPTM